MGIADKLIKDALDALGLDENTLKDLKTELPRLFKRLELLEKRVLANTLTLKYAFPDEYEKAKEQVKAYYLRKAKDSSEETDDQG